MTKPTDRYNLRPPTVRPPNRGKFADVLIQERGPTDTFTSPADFAAVCDPNLPRLVKGKSWRGLGTYLIRKVTDELNIQSGDDGRYTLTMRIRGKVKPDSTAPGVIEL